MKTLLFIFLISMQSVIGQSIEGFWSGELDIQGKKIPIVVHVIKKDGVLSSTLGLPTQGVKDLPIRETTFENNEFSFDVTALGIKYKGFLNTSDKIEGTFTQNGFNLPLILKKGELLLKRPQTPASPYNYFTEEVTLKNEADGNLLAGTLAAPNQKKNIPILVMITGSGSQNRDEEIMGHKPFLVIADYFAKNGIATLRLDDRGIGGSESGKPGATSADFAEDINSAVNFLAEKGYTNIGLMGHSEGGMIAPMVAAENSKVNFLVLMAGPGIALSKMMPIQMLNLYKGMGLTETILKQITDGYAKFFEEIKSDESSISNVAIKERLEQIHDGLNPELKKPLISQMMPMFSSEWGRYFISFEPDVYLSTLKIPVLAINGSLDMNVPSKVNLEGIKKSLEKADNKKFELVEFEGLNHLFQTAKTGLPAEYGEIEETISPKVLEKITSWIKKLKR